MIGDSITRKEVEAKLASVGDYVKMDFLQQCLRKNLDFDTKKFVLLKLSAVYESRMMFLESGKMIRIAADINTTYEAKINDFVKSAELFIKGGNYDEADVSLAKAFASANEKQKVPVRQRIKTAYKNQAQDLLKKDKRKNATDVYEKMLTLPYLDANERKEAQKTLLHLYQKLGKIREMYALQKSIDNPTTIVKPGFEESGRRFERGDRSSSRDEPEFNADDLLR